MKAFPTLRKILITGCLWASGVAAPAQGFSAGSDYVNLVVQEADPVREFLVSITTAPGSGTMKLDITGAVGVGGVASGTGIVDLNFRWKDLGGVWHDAAPVTYSATPGASTPFTMSTVLPVSPNEFGFRATFGVGSTMGAIINVGGGTPPNFHWTPVPEPCDSAIAAGLVLTGLAAWRRVQASLVRVDADA